MLPRALRLVVLTSCVAALGLPADAQPQQDRGSRLKRLEQIRETQRENRATQVSEESLGAVTANIRQDAFGRRDMLVYLPSHLPPKGERSLLVALHGGGGNAQFMLDHLKIDGVAETPNCPSARGHTIFNYHGTEDANLPVAGGHGSKGVTHLDFTSQEQARTLFESSGGRYVLQLYPGTDHSIEHLSEASQRQDGISIAERIARDLGLLSRR